MNWRMKIVCVNATLLAVVAMSAAPSASRGNRVVVANDWEDLFESGHSKAGVTGIVYDIIEYQGDIYIAGEFKYAGGTDNDVVNSIVRWDDSETAWEPLKPGTNAGVQIVGGGEGRVRDLATWTNNGTTYLVIVGNFDKAGGADQENIVLWDGTVFVGVDGDDLGATAGLAAAEVFGVNDDLYVISYQGSFVNNNMRYALAFWNGSIWVRTALGTFGGGAAPRGLIVQKQVLRKDGNLLYIGGKFGCWTPDGEDPVLLSCIAKYSVLNGIQPLDGSNSGVYRNGGAGYVYAIEVCGNDVFIGGNFDEAGPASARIDAENIVRFDASTLTPWLELDGGVNNEVHGLLARDCSTPTATLFVGGKFSDVDGDDGVDTDHLAIASYSILSKTWHSDTFDGGLSVTAGGAGTVEGILSFTVDGDIYAAGSFFKSPGLPFEFISDSDPLNNVGHWDPQ